MKKITLIYLALIAFSAQAELRVVPSEQVGKNFAQNTVMQKIVSSVNELRQKIVTTIGDESCPLMVTSKDHEIIIKDGLPFVVVPEGDKIGLDGYKIGDRLTTYSYGISGGWKRTDGKSSGVLYESAPSDVNKFSGEADAIYSKRASDEDGYGCSVLEAYLLPSTAQITTIIGTAWWKEEEEVCKQRYEKALEIFHKKNWRTFGGYRDENRGGRQARVFTSNAYPDVEITFSLYYSRNGKSGTMKITYRHKDLWKQRYDEINTIGEGVCVIIEKYCRDNDVKDFRDVFRTFNVSEVEVVANENVSEGARRLVLQRKAPERGGSVLASPELDAARAENQKRQKAMREYQARKSLAFARDNYLKLLSAKEEASKLPEGVRKMYEQRLASSWRSVVHCLERHKAILAGMTEGELASAKQIMQDEESLDEFVKSIAIDPVKKEALRAEIDQKLKEVLSSGVEDTKRSLEMLAAAMETYKASHNGTLAQLKRLYDDSSAAGIELPLKDAWGNEFVLQCRGSEYKFVSCGPDGLRGNEDDISKGNN